MRKKETPEKYCEYCKARLIRGIAASGRLEKMTNFLQRRFCNQRCAGAWKSAAGVGHVTHGATRGGNLTGAYRSWLSMIQRCEYPKHLHFDNYGGRGIKICDRWRQSYENFLADMGPRPDGCSIDRIDSNGNYEPDNCKWANRQTQNRNRRDNVLITFQGRTQCLKDWAKELGIGYGTLTTRFFRLKWPIEDLFEPTRPTGGHRPKGQRVALR